MRHFTCAKCGEKVNSEFLKPGEKYFHKECGGTTVVPEDSQSINEEQDIPSIESKGGSSQKLSRTSPNKTPTDTATTNLGGNLISFKCSECGKLLTPDDARPGTAYFHSACGGYTKVPYEERLEAGLPLSKNIHKKAKGKQANVLQCPHCKSEQDKDAIYCSNCGKRIVEPKTKNVMVCTACGEMYGVSVKYCKKDGTKLEEKEIEVSNHGLNTRLVNSSTQQRNHNSDKEIINDSDFPEGDDEGNAWSFISRLSNGEFGLPFTFWIFGFAVSFTLQIVLRFIDSTSIFLVMTIAYHVYQIPVLFGVWRAANKYEKPTLWETLAKATVVLGWIGWIITFILFLSYFTE